MLLVPIWRRPLRGVEASWDFGNPRVIGYIPDRDGRQVLSSEVRKYPSVYRHVMGAASRMGLDADGALLAVGVSKLPQVHPQSTVGLLVSWPRSRLADLTYRDLRPFWGTNLERHLGEWSDPADYCHVFFYSCRAKEGREDEEEDDDSWTWRPRSFGQEMTSAGPGPRASSSSPSGAVDAAPVDEEMPALVDDESDDEEEKGGSKGGRGYWPGWRRFFRDFNRPVRERQQEGLSQFPPLPSEVEEHFLPESDVDAWVTAQAVEDESVVVPGDTEEYQLVDHNLRYFVIRSWFCGLPRPLRRDLPRSRRSGLAWSCPKQWR